MKLIYCLKCKDVVCLIPEKWRLCDCKSSGGQYNEDKVTATIGGRCKVFGIGNPFFNPLFHELRNSEKRRLRKKYFDQPDTDIWFGEFDGDEQVFRIESPKGPRLKTSVVKWEKNEKTFKVEDDRYFITRGGQLKERGYEFTIGWDFKFPSRKKS